MRISCLSVTIQGTQYEYASINPLPQKVAGCCLHTLKTTCSPPDTISQIVVTVCKRGWRRHAQLATFGDGKRVKRLDLLSSPIIRVTRETDSSYKQIVLTG